MKVINIIGAVTALLLAAGIWLASGPSGRQATADVVDVEAPLQGLEAVLYKSPTCGCCGAYTAFLRDHGMRVREVADDAAVMRTKRDHGIPSRGYSCHTIELDGYVVEGHVPLAALEKLIAERPAVDGLVLPGMPSGTPGMPGPRTGSIEVLELTDGALRPYLGL